MAQEASGSLVNLKLLGSRQSEVEEPVASTDNAPAANPPPPPAVAAPAAASGLEENKKTTEEEEKGEAKDARLKKEGLLTTTEGRVKGAVKSAVLGKYFRAAGGVWVGVLLLILFTVGQLCKTASDVWLAHW
jgi:uncharacterized membrane protein